MSPEQSPHPPPALLLLSPWPACRTSAPLPCTIHANRNLLAIFSGTIVGALLALQLRLRCVVVVML
jgi:hypothetical protein